MHDIYEGRSSVHFEDKMVFVIISDAGITLNEH